MSLAFKIICGIALGMIFGFILGYFGRGLFILKWEGEVKLEMFVNLLSAVVIAGFLSQALQKRTETSRTEVNMILEPIKTAILSLNSINSEFKNSRRLLAPRVNSTSSLIERFNVLSSALYTAKNLVVCFEYKTYEKTIEEIEQAVFIYKFGITDGDPQKPYDINENKAQEERFNVLNNKLLILIRDINRQ